MKCNQITTERIFKFFDKHTALDGDCSKVHFDYDNGDLPNVWQTRDYAINLAMSEKETTLLQRYTTAKRFGSYVPILKKDITAINSRIKFLEQEEAKLYKIKPSIPVWDISTEEKRIIS